MVTIQGMILVSAAPVGASLVLALGRHKACPYDIPVVAACSIYSPDTR